MRPLLAVTHLEAALTGTLGAVAAEAGLEVLGLNLQTGDGRRPALEEIAGIASFGGEMSVRQASEHPLIEWELGLMGEAAAAGVPVLGFCLGAQLLASALGRDILPMPRTQSRWVEIHPTAAAAADPVFRHLRDRMHTLEWHEDYFELPQGAVELVQRDSTGCAAFRFGECAWGTQFHIEADRAMIGGWIADGREDLRGEGVDPDAFLAESLRRLPAQVAVARPLLRAFVDLVREREGAPVGAAGARN